MSLSNSKTKNIADIIPDDVIPKKDISIGSGIKKKSKKTSRQKNQIKKACKASKKKGIE